MNRLFQNKAFWALFLLLLVGCSTSVSRDDLKNLNGYWEIEQVEFPSGNAKEYRINTTVDYIQLEGMEGFRKKVQPKLGGTYQTSDDAEAFQIEQNNGTFVLRYTTELSEWTEDLVALDEDTFSVMNEDGKRYDYRRFEPIIVDKE